MHPRANLKEVRAVIMKLLNVTMESELTILFADAELTDGNALLADLGIASKSVLTAAKRKAVFDLIDPDDLKLLLSILEQGQIKAFEFDMTNPESGKRCERFTISGGQITGPFNSGQVPWTGQCRIYRQGIAEIWHPSMDPSHLSNHEMMRSFFEEGFSGRSRRTTFDGRQFRRNSPRKAELRSGEISCVHSNLAMTGIGGLFDLQIWSSGSRSDRSPRVTWPMFDWRRRESNIMFHTAPFRSGFKCVFTVKEWLPGLFVARDNDSNSCVLS